MSGRPRLSCVAWKWGSRFSSTHVNVLRAALDRHLHLDHELVLVTDDAAGVDGDVRVLPMPTGYAETPRCRRRMQGFSREFRAALGSRVLYLDLDIVIVDDITPIVDRTEPIVGWKVGHAGVLSGSFLLADNGALDGAWQRFHVEPETYPARLGGNASDQAMVNDWLASQPPVPYWTEADGFVTFYGAGYERLEYLGVGPTRRELPTGARIVVLGGADLHVLEDASYPWVAEHWQALRATLEVSQ